MKKKLHGKLPRASKPRNAAMPRALSRHISRRRNAAPRGGHDHSFKDLMIPAAISTAITTTAGVVGASQNWSAEKVAAGVALGGVVAAWIGDGDMIKNVGSGVAAAATAQLAMTVLDKRKAQTLVVAQAAPAAKRPSNAGEVPPEAVREALERVRTRMAMQREMDEDQADA
jgi:hypothetical protein